ncbi:MAG TPA: hypothetical protein VK890_05985, partial [Bacteroidia bacterium]|nr:hypothetical protein [Bacteroidia bacterium]
QLRIKNYELRIMSIEENNSPGIWAFPFLGRVGLYAISPRFAVGFPLPSLTQEQEGVSDPN